MRQHYTRDILLFCSLIIFCALFAHGQSFGPYTITGTQCATVDATQKGTAAFQIIGTWSGTIQPAVAIAGQAAVSTSASPVLTFAPQANITANGAFYSNISGYSVFQVCGASVTGTATIYINVSSASR